MTTQLILVEDDAGLRGDLVEFLELEGFSVVSCGNALEFFRKLVGQTFGVALIDLGLPDEAGEVLVDYVRRNTTSSIVVLTARDTLETRVQCYRNGADLFLGKPVNCIELATIIRNLLKRRVATSSSEYTAAISFFKQFLAVRPEGARAGIFNSQDGPRALRANADIDDRLSGYRILHRIFD